MAGEWLKFEASTPEKREVFSITVAMGWDDPDLTVGKLLKVWRWFDQQTIDGNAPCVTLALLDRIIGVSGFAKAMCDVGWLVCGEAGVSLPNFDRHNGKTAKDRCLTAKRVAKHKTNAAGNAASVSGALPKEEKSREDTEVNTKSCPAQEPDAPGLPGVAVERRADLQDAIEQKLPKGPAGKPRKHHGSEEDHKAARWIFEQVLKLNATATEPNWDGWANDVRLMREIDGRTHHDICELFKWASKDVFWCSNILSPSKLREKWDQLVVQRGRPGRSTPNAATDQKFRPNASDYSSSDAAMAKTLERHGVVVDMTEDIKF